MILKLSTPQHANETIMNGFCVMGQCLPIKKLCREACRCLRCQKMEPGHLARDCEMIDDVCGTCSGLHSTQECTEDRRRCVNCQGAHASWDRTCPAFLEATRKIQQSNSLEQYRFYPLADDPDSWEHLETPSMPLSGPTHISPSQFEPFVWSDDPPERRPPPPHKHRGCHLPPRPQSRSRALSPNAD